MNRGDFGCSDVERVTGLVVPAFGARQAGPETQGGNLRIGWIEHTGDINSIGWAVVIVRIAASRRRRVIRQWW